MKRSIKVSIAFLILCATGSAYAQSCAGMSLGNNASLNGFVPFPSTNAWNTNIASAPLDPNSAAITAAAGFAGLSLHPDFGSESGYGIPYVVVDSTITPPAPIHIIDYANQSDVVVAPYPVTAPIEGYPADCSGWPNTYNGDAHVLVLDRAKCELYETFNTNRCNGQYDASSETIWDMHNNESRPWGWTSADAAGLPIFPGLIRYDEIASGAIKHAIRFTMQVTKNDANGGYFVEPATHAAGVYWGVSNVMGMRIRLKASFDISGYSKVNQVILTAMKEYGMILADNGSYFFFQGASDPRFDDNDLDNLKGVASSNFEVVQMTPAFPGWDPATAPTGALPKIDSFTASKESVSAGSAVTLSYSLSGDSYDYIDMIGPVAAGSGSVIISPTATQTYTLYSTNAYGQAVSTPLTVTVPGSVVAAPVFTPPAGSYGTVKAVTISSATYPYAAIYYTTDGSTPTYPITGTTQKYPLTPTPPNSTGAVNSITVGVSQTVKAIATVIGYSAPSAVSSATYGSGASTAAAPVFSLAAGTYSSAQSVTLTDATTGAAIYYTTSGSAPTTSSTKYTGAITVSATETIKAIAVATGYTNSAVASATYAISALVAATPVISLKAGTYSSAQSVTLTDATTGAAIYYTTSGSAPTTSSTKYTGAITVSLTETIEAIAVATGYTNSAVASAAYTISAPVAATPVFSLKAGTYSSAQSVTISDATPGVTIYYTTNGSAPTARSTKYTVAIPVSSTETIAAIAVAAGYTSSAVASATYTISAPVAATPVFSLKAGTYPAAQSVTLTDATTGAAIYYTTSGSAPTASSTKYTGAIKVSSTETIAAIAVAAGYTSSAVASATYTISTPAATTPVYSLKAGTYSSAQSVTISDATAGAAIYYTTGSSAPTTGSTKYTGAITVSLTETIEAIAVATGYTNSGAASASYTIIGSPTALAVPATAVSAQGATLNAIVNGFGLIGSTVFQYGRSNTALTSSTAASTLSASANSVAVSAQLSGLTAKTTYYYRVVATTAGGTATAEVLSFTTN